MQTIGSAGESIAAGVVFTIPALPLPRRAAEHEYFNYVQIFTLAAVGGILGVLLMVPLRRALIVKEHGILPYPEGTACADVLIAGEKGGDLAKMVFAGFGIAMLYKLLHEFFGAVAGDVPTLITDGRTARLPERHAVTARSRPSTSASATSSARASPASWSSGGVLVVAGPHPAALDASCPTRRDHAPTCRTLGFTRRLDRRAHSQAEWIYRAYVRYIGAGAVAMRAA